MFICRADRHLGVVHKLLSHGALREGSAVGHFTAEFLPSDALIQFVHF